MKCRIKKMITLVVIMTMSSSVFAQRVVISLNGRWDVEETMGARDIPVRYLHTVDIPGLINQSTPAFSMVDEYFSKEYCNNTFVQPALRKKGITVDGIKTGYTFQKRNYFWYHRSIQIDTKGDIYILKINKAQFGTAVWVNGKKAGESLDCFASQSYDITNDIRVGRKNTIVIRVGAHPGVLPDSAFVSFDYEKRHWTPGIYDDISIIASRYPYIESIQVAPDIHKSEIAVQTVIITKPGYEKFEMDYSVKEWKSEKIIFTKSIKSVTGNSTRTMIAQKVSVPDARLWSPESPFLYTVHVSTGGDDISVRFGMRAFRFETATKRAYLNDSIIFLRGSNITLHRFFDDSLCKNYPWNDQWVRKLLKDLPHKYNWNSFRFCIGPVPEKWFDIADEEGLLIQNEYPIWIWQNKSNWDSLLLAGQIKQWMRDSWNHPSLAWWDICNETYSDVLNDLIKDLRSTDLSNRPWDNGFHLPQGDDDPVEDHNYKWYAPFPGVKDCDIWNPQKFEKGTGEKSSAYTPHPTAHAAVLNEYGFLWLKRNGEKTLLTGGIYDSIGKGLNNERRQALYGYLLAAETEYFRAHRNYAGILHFDYLSGDFDGAITGDIFKDPETLEPVKIYDDYFSEIFKPLGVYVNYFPKEVAPGANPAIAVMLINDDHHRITGQVSMDLFNEKEELVGTATQVFDMAALGQQTVTIRFRFPITKGNYWLKTLAEDENGCKTLCRRKIIIN